MWVQCHYKENALSTPTLKSCNLTPSYSTCCLYTLTCSIFSSKQMYCLGSHCLACTAIFVRRYAISQCTNKPCTVQLLWKFVVGLQSQTTAIVFDKANHYADGTGRHFKQQTQSTRRPARKCEGAAQLSCKPRPQLHSLIRSLGIMIVETSKCRV